MSRLVVEAVVASGTGLDAVVSGPSAHEVRAAARGQRVVALVAEQFVRLRVADERVRECRAGQALDPAERVRAVAGGALRCEVGVHG